MATATEPQQGSGDRLRLGGDLWINRLGFGAMRLTGPGIWGEPSDRDQAKAVLRRAVELGVNFIDTADSYGPHVNEILIAEALHPYPNGLLVATKGGMLRSGPNVWTNEASPAHLRTACEGSLRRLRVECIDLYQLHAVDPKVPLEGSLDTLAKLQKEGKIRYIGLSNVNVEQLELARRMIDVVSVQNRYHMTDRSSDEVLRACEHYDLPFFPWYPLAAGKHGRLDELPERLARVASRLSATAAQVAICWLLARSRVMTPIPGTSTVKHLEENMAASQLILSGQDLEELDGAVVATM